MTGILTLLRPCGLAATLGIIFVEVLYIAKEIKGSIYGMRGFRGSTNGAEKGSKGA